MYSMRPFHIFMKTFEQFKQEWREKEKQPRDPNSKLTCACGKCPLDIKPASDESLQGIYEILYPKLT